MKMNPRWASRFGQADVSTEKDSSNLEKLDSLIEQVNLCCDRSRTVPVGELECLRLSAVYCLDKLVPNCREHREAVERLRFTVTARRLKAGQVLSLKNQGLLYRNLSKLCRVLKQVRRIVAGQSRRRASRAWQGNALKRVIADRMRQFPNLRQRQICGKVDEYYEKANRPVLPLPQNWKKAGANNLVTAYDNPKLRKNVKSYLSKINPENSPAI